MRATHYDMQSALNDDYRFITTFYNWNFLLDRYDIPLNAAYSTGTVTVAQGSTSVVGLGTTWLTTWTNKKILLSGNNEEKEIASVGSNTTLTLRYPYNSSATALSGLGYMIYQDSFPLPISPGRDLSIVNPVYWWQPIRKWDRVRFDTASSSYGRFYAGVTPSIYTDNGIDTSPSPSTTTGQPLIQFWPLTLTQQDLVLRFFRQFVPLALPADTTILPPEFEEVLIKLSKARLKQRYGIPGWTDDRSIAMQMLLQFREAAATQPAFEFSKQDGMGGGMNDSYATDMSLGNGWPGVLNSWPGGFP